VPQPPTNPRSIVTDIPADLRYTADHEWVRRTGEDTVRVGITDFAQSSLGDVVYVQLPEVGAAVTAGESFGEVESTKSVSDLYAPLSGTVVAVNAELEANPQLINAEPYGQGWLVDLRSEGADDGLAGLMDADGYQSTLA
jgi:glycine cleavage system H protein